MGMFKLTNLMGQQVGDRKKRKLNTNFGWQFFVSATNRVLTTPISQCVFGYCCLAIKHRYYQSIWLKRQFKNVASVTRIRLFLSFERLNCFSRSWHCVRRLAASLASFIFFGAWGFEASTAFLTESLLRLTQLAAFAHGDSFFFRMRFLRMESFGLDLAGQRDQAGWWWQGGVSRVFE